MEWSRPPVRVCRARKRFTGSINRWRERVYVLVPFREIVECACADDGRDLRHALLSLFIVRKPIRSLTAPGMSSEKRWLVDRQLRLPIVFSAPFTDALEGRERGLLR